MVTARGRPSWHTWPVRRGLIRAIIIGAGRGRRLMPLTDDTPKCYAEVGGRRIIDWTLDALGAWAALACVSGAAVLLGRVLLRHVRLSVVRYVAAGVCAVLAMITLIGALA